MVPPACCLVSPPRQTPAVGGKRQLLAFGHSQSSRSCRCSRGFKGLWKQKQFQRGALTHSLPHPLPWSRGLCCGWGLFLCSGVLMLNARDPFGGCKNPIAFISCLDGQNLGSTQSLKIEDVKHRPSFSPQPPPACPVGLSGTGVSAQEGGAPASVTAWWPRFSRLRSATAPGGGRQSCLKEKRTGKEFGGGRLAGCCTIRPGAASGTGWTAPQRPFPPAGRWRSLVRDAPAGGAMIHLPPRSCRSGRRSRGISLGDFWNFRKLPPILLCA